MLIRAKTVIMATGCGATRLYNNQPSPGWMFNTAYLGCNAGAMAQAWRIGARYVNMELPVRWAGPRYFARCGKGSWIGVLRYPDGRPIGPFVTKSNCEYGDITSDVWNTVFADVMRNGTGPAYIDTSDAGSEELDKQRKGFVSEGLTCILNYMKDNNLDFSHIFQDEGITYVRFTASNDAATCDYYSPAYEVSIGSSELVCPNAFSP